MQSMCNYARFVNVHDYGEFNLQFTRQIKIGFVDCLESDRWERQKTPWLVVSRLTCLDLQSGKWTTRA